MRSRVRVSADDLRDSAALCADSLRRLDPTLWDKQAYGLDWTRSRATTHIGEALAFYSTSLASRAEDNPGSRGLRLQEGTIEAAAGQVETGASVLARIAESTPPDTRAFHPTGLPDAEGFLGMGCVEILLHGHDVVTGTAAEFDPDDDLCQRILGRLFPWAPMNTPGWVTLLWATGRGKLENQEYLGESWVWHNDLLNEWEGSIPNSSVWIGRQ